MKLLRNILKVESTTFAYFMGLLTGTVIASDDTSPLEAFLYTLLTMFLVQTAKLIWKSPE